MRTFWGQTSASVALLGGVPGFFTPRPAPPWCFPSGSPAATSTKTQALIDTAKSLAGQSKWAEVLQTLASLAGQDLTATQQGVVDNLKTEAQKQAQAEAVKSATQQGTNALGGLLNRNREHETTVQTEKS